MTEFFIFVRKFIFFKETFNKKLYKQKIKKDKNSENTSKLLNSIK